MSPSVSIILVTYNSAPHLAACSAALRALRYDSLPQIIVVDNASQDTSAAMVRQLLPESLLLPQASNLGFAGGVQCGVAASNGEYLILLNPDTIVDPGWLEALVTMLADPRCGIAGSKIVALDGKTLLHTGGSISQPDLLASHRGSGEPDCGQYAQPEAVPFVTGASLALRRTLWDKLGGLDAGFFPGYFEDVDLCWRAKALGKQCWYAPQSLLRHSESASTGKYSGSFYYYHHLNRLRFACKHLEWLELWHNFAPAEAQRLRDSSSLDRAVASLVYRQALPHGLDLPTPDIQTLILARGRTLATIKGNQQDQPETWPTEARLLLGLQTSSQTSLSALLATAASEAVLSEHQFRSALPFVARLRRTWNSVATRWYVLPLLHQQTRFNLAVQRSIRQVDVQMQCAVIETELRQALLCFRMAQLQSEFN